MKHEIKARYAAPSNVVMKMFTDKSFYPRKLDALGIPSHQVVECDKKGSDFRIKIEFKLPMQVPGMLKKLISAESTVVQDERWNAKTKAGHVSVAIHGVPVEMSCAMAAADEGNGCVITYCWDIHARIPLVGGSVEKFIRADVDNRSEKEQRAISTMLAEYR